MSRQWQFFSSQKVITVMKVSSQEEEYLMEFGCPFHLGKKENKINPKKMIS